MVPRNSNSNVTCINQCLCFSTENIHIFKINIDINTGRKLHGIPDFQYTSFRYVYCFFGTPVSWYVVSLVHRFSGILLFRYTGFSVCFFLWYTGFLVYCFFGTPIFRYIASSVHRFSGILFLWYTGFPVYRFFIHCIFYLDTFHVYKICDCSLTSLSRMIFRHSQTFTR